ncbi:hypothetical protein [Cohnella zeiphila]|uniref:Secreted protein n=1 Tax=Cohnella zeiphila TaxID=2761120 RepID=A0A7X0VWY5_9BACL|nr:hypothetical protein [Cohnella zeiphila]MBB6732985.1 hypothetical protein [Cohnella zeiphila]
MSMSRFMPRGRHIRKNLAVSVVLASLLVFASACGSGNSSNTNAGASSSAPPSASSSASSSSEASASPSASPESSPSASSSPESPASASPSSDAESGNPYEVAGVNDPAAFEQMFSSLQKAVADSDKEEAAKYVLYPLRVNGGKEPLTIQDKDDFVAKFDLIFTDDVKKALADQKPREMFVNDKGVMAGGGQIWFGATADSEQKYGMIAVNLNV